MKKIINFFASLKTAISLIILLTVLAIIGTLIPQREEAIEYIKRYPRIWHSILQFGFDDIYRNPIFIGVLVLLSISALVCVLIRWKKVYKKFISKIDDVKLEEILSLKASKTVNKSLDEKLLVNYQLLDLSDGSKLAYKSSGKLALIGGLILHIGLVLIFAGGLLGLIFGVEMPIVGKAGEKSPVPSLEVIRAAYKADKISRKARHIRQFNPNNPELDVMRTQLENLVQIYDNGIMHPDFKVSFDKLWIENYSNASGTNMGVKSWNVELRFIDIASGSLFNETNKTNPILIKVNEPVSYKNFDFYLANWSKNWGKIKLTFDYLPNIEGWETYKPELASFPQDIEIAPNEPFEISGFPYTLVVNSFFPDFRIANGNIFNASNELKNPAVMVVAFDREKNTKAGHTWAFTDDKSAMSNHVSNLPFKVVFKNADYSYEATLQMTYDPGKPLVWIGCLMFCLGMMLTFYINYREEWIIIKPNGNTFIALNSNRSPEILIKELPDIEKKLFQNS